MTIELPPDKQVVAKEILAKCHKFADTLFYEESLPKAIMFTIAWNSDDSDLPVGTLTARNDMNTGVLIALLQQMCKQDSRLLQVVLDQMLALQAKCNKTTNRNTISTS